MTTIAWTKETWEATPIVDRGGRRIRLYQRSTAGPSHRARKQMAAVGYTWCRNCALWLPASTVRKGLCRTHQNDEYRHNYANGGNVATRARVHARKRGIDPIPREGIALLLESFEGLCAYCSEPADTFDHIVPISRGGRTIPGNMVPACNSCNSSKKAKPLFPWLDSRRKGVEHPQLMEVLSQQACDLDDLGVPEGL